MARRDLLPGVRTDSCPPRVISDCRREIVRARRRATTCDIAQLMLLVGVDWMFARWPFAHVPSMDRKDSMLVLVGLHALVVTQMALTRMFPRWSARRIATTWCLRERARFFQSRL
jgi:hypothetical protein